MAIAFAAGCVFASPADAQGQSAPSAIEPGDIVVTAQKRSESIQKVPIAITAFNGDQLARQQVRAATDLGGIVPNLAVQSPLGESVPIFSLRGVTMSDTSIGQDGPVAVYYDEVYKGNVALLGIGLFDLERVEVLKGPQGTLYGKNTTGGAINFVSRKPDFTTSANLAVGYGNYNQRQIEGGAQTAIGDTIAIRIAGTFDRASGWIKNDAPGEPNLESTRQYGLRGTVLFRPSDRFNLTIRASTSLQDPLIYGVPAPALGDGIGSPYYPATGTGGVALLPDQRIGLGKREVDVPSVQRRRARTNAFEATANYKLTDALSLTSISSWDEGKLFIHEDADGTPLKVIDAQYVGTTKQISEDFRLTTNFDGPFDIIVGGYYNREKIFNSSRLGYFTDIDLNGDGIVDAADCIAGGGFISCNLTNHFDQLKTSLAAYSDATYALTDRLKIRGGLRFTHDTGRLYNAASDVTAADGTFVNNNIPGVAGETASLRFSNNNLSGKIGADYAFTKQILVYANYSKGYRGSSFNQQFFFSPAELSIAKPEKLASIEAGVKAQFWDRRITFNASVFSYIYRNQQFLDVNPVTAVLSLINVPKSKIEGTDIELDVRPLPGLTLSSGFGYLDSRVKNGSSSGVSLRGNRLPNAPTVTATGAIDWKTHVLDGKNADFHIDGAYTAKQYYDLQNRATTTQGGYFILNGRLRFSAADDRRGIALWVKNATNAFFYTNLADLTGFGEVYAHVSPPRTFGVTLDSKF